MVKQLDKQDCLAIIEPYQDGNEEADVRKNQHKTKYTWVSVNGNVIDRFSDRETAVSHAMMYGGWVIDPLYR